MRAFKRTVLSTPRPLGSDVVPDFPLHAEETVEVQISRCTTPAYSGLPSCLACAKSKGGEHCRFRKIRLVARSPDGNGRSLGAFASGSGYKLAEREASGDMTKRALVAEQRAAQHVLAHICRPFLSTLAAEKALVPSGASVTTATSQMIIGSANPAHEVRAAQTLDRRVPGERQLCDWCETTILCFYSACPHCGFEVCAACYDAWASGGKPLAAERMCGHAIQSWCHFSRIASPPLAELVDAAEAWCTTQASRAAGLPPPMPPFSLTVRGQSRTLHGCGGELPGLAATGLAADCPACRGRHRAHTCSRGPGMSLSSGPSSKALSVCLTAISRLPGGSGMAGGQVDEQLEERASGGVSQESENATDQAVSPNARAAETSIGLTGAEEGQASQASGKGGRDGETSVGILPTWAIEGQAVQPATGLSEPPPPEQSKRQQSSSSPSVAHYGTRGSNSRSAPRHRHPCRMRLDEPQDETAFLRIWARGEPIVAEGVGSRFWDWMEPNRPR